MGYKIAQVEDLKKKISELPELDNSEREVTKQEAIKLLSKEISLLQKRGYSIAMVADVLTRNGMEISIPTLKTYLTRSDSSYRKKDSKKITSNKKTNGDKTKSSSKNYGEKLDAKEIKSSAFIPRQDSEEI